jgi:hypothetical protein
MPDLSTSIALLQDTAKALREVISATANEAMPEDLAIEVGWLNDIQRIVAEAQEMVGHHARFSKSGTSVTKMTRSVAVAAPATSRRPRKGEYPRFLRDAHGGHLIKVGWSKKARAEYEHKAPRAVISAMVQIIAEAGRNRKRFVMEKLMPFHDPTSGVPLPDYQAYIVLAWLRSVGIVIQHGRQGYTLSNGSLNDEVIEKLWNSIPTR